MVATSIAQLGGGVVVVVVVVVVVEVVVGVVVVVEVVVVVGEVLDDVVDVLDDVLEVVVEPVVEVSDVEVDVVELSEVEVAVVEVSDVEVADVVVDVLEVVGVLVVEALEDAVLDVVDVGISLAPAVVRVVVVGAGADGPGDGRTSASGECRLGGSRWWTLRGRRLRTVWRVLRRWPREWRLAGRECAPAPSAWPQHSKAATTARRRKHFIGDPNMPIGP